MHPLCIDQQVGVLPWSPLARGRLTRDWEEATARSNADEFGASMYKQEDKSNQDIAAAVAHIAERRGVSRAQVALAWVRSRPAVTAPIVGVTKSRHLDDAVASLQLCLDETEVRELEQPYTPRLPEGF